MYPVFDKNKPAERRNKVLMVYAAKKGWYREDANMSVLEPQDVLRISTMLESWGNIDIAQNWIFHQKNRLFNNIESELQFQLGEIETDTKDDIEKLKIRLKKAEDILKEKESAGKKPTAADRKALDIADKALKKAVADKEARIKAAHEKAKKQRNAISDVEQELLQMFADPELRKRYFAIVDMDEIEENEFNLNIPRYVDTFEPEQQIDLKEAIADFQNAIQSESQTEKELADLLKKLTL